MSKETCSTAATCSLFPHQPRSSAQAPDGMRQVRVLREVPAQWTHTLTRHLSAHHLQRVCVYHHVNKHYDDRPFIVLTETKFSLPLPPNLGSPVGEGSLRKLHAPVDGIPGASLAAHECIKLCFSVPPRLCLRRRLCDGFLVQACRAHRTAVQHSERRSKACRRTWRVSRERKHWVQQGRVSLYHSIEVPLDHCGTVVASARSALLGPQFGVEARLAAG